MNAPAAVESSGPARRRRPGRGPDGGVPHVGRQRPGLGRRGQLHREKPRSRSDSGDDEQHGQPLRVRLARHLRRRGPDHSQTLAGHRLDGVARRQDVHLPAPAERALREREPADLGGREVVAGPGAVPQEQPRLLPELGRGRPRPRPSHRGAQAQGAEPVPPADPGELQPRCGRQQARQSAWGRRQPRREGQGQGGAFPARAVRRHGRLRHGALCSRSGDRAGPEPQPLARGAQGRAHRDPQHHGASRPEAPARARRPRHRHRARPGPDARPPERVRRHHQGESRRHDLLRPDERRPAGRRPVRQSEGPAGRALRPRLRRDPGAGGAGRRPARRRHPHGLRGRARSAPGASAPTAIAPARSCGRRTWAR